MTSLSTLQKIAANAEKSKASQAVSGAGVRVVPLHLIDFDSTQPRQDFYTPDGVIAPEVQEKLQELASSMKIHGQQAEVTLIELDNGRFKIAVGERRVRAAHLLEWKDIRANIRNDLKGVSLRLFRLAENVDRADLSELDTARYIADIVAAGEMKKHELAAHFGKKPAWVTRYLAFADDANYQKWVKPGYIQKAWILYAVTQLPDEVQDQIYAMCASRDSGELTSQELRRFEAMVKRGLPVAPLDAGGGTAADASSPSNVLDPAAAAQRMMMNADTAEIPDGYRPPDGLSAEGLEPHDGKLRTMDNTPGNSASTIPREESKGTPAGQGSGATHTPGNIVTSQLSVGQLSAILVHLQKKKAKASGTLQSLSVSFRLPELVVREVLSALGEADEVESLPPMMLGLKLAEAGHKLANK